MSRDPQSHSRSTIVRAVGAHLLISALLSWLVFSVTSLASGYQEQVQRYTSALDVLDRQSTIVVTPDMLHHRETHLVSDGRTLGLGSAIAAGYQPCTECEPTVPNLPPKPERSLAYFLGGFILVTTLAIGVVRLVSAGSVSGRQSTTSSLAKGETYGALRDQCLVTAETLEVLLSHMPGITRANLDRALIDAIALAVVRWGCYWTERSQLASDDVLRLSREVAATAEEFSPSGATPSIEHRKRFARRCQRYERILKQITDDETGKLSHDGTYLLLARILRDGEISLEGVAASPAQQMNITLQFHEILTSITVFFRRTYPPQADSSLIGRLASAWSL